MCKYQVLPGTMWSHPGVRTCARILGMQQPRHDTDHGMSMCGSESRLRHFLAAWTWASQCTAPSFLPFPQPNTKLTRGLPRSWPKDSTAGRVKALA